MKIVFAGNNERGIACLQALAKSKHVEILTTISQPFGGSRDGYFRPIAAEARSLGLDVIEPKNVNAPSVAEYLAALQPDVFVMVGFPQVLGRKVRSIPRYGSINVHASPLPRYRGAAPLNWMLIYGEREGAITVLEADDGIDTGPILMQEPFPISKSANIRDITKHVNSRTPVLVDKVLADFPHLWNNRTPQIRTEGFFMTRRRPEDGLVDFSTLSASEIRNLARALVHPYPGAFFFYGGNRYRIEEADFPECQYHGKPGRVAAREDKGIVVIARDQGILLRSLRLDDDSVVRADTTNLRIGTDIEPAGHHHMRVTP